MFGTIKRLLIGLAVAVVIFGGSLLAPHGADAYQRVLRSDDGKLVFVCYYDDRTGQLAFCDVYYFPLQASAGVAQ